MKNLNPTESNSNNTKDSITGITDENITARKFASESCPLPL